MSGGASAAATWALEDLAAWGFLMDGDGPLNALFREALRNEWLVCLPPDCSLPSGPNGALLPPTVETMRFHMFEPDTVFKGRFRAVANSKALVLVDEDPKRQNQLVRVRIDGDGWPNEGPSSAAVLFSEDIRTGGEGRARIAVLDRALVGVPPPHPAKFVHFGDNPDDNITHATELLFNVDRTGELMRCLNSEVQAFRDHYEPVPGYEDDLFNRVASIAETQSRRWVGALGKGFVSRAKSERAIRLAVNCYVHARLYQLAFGAMCELHEPDEAAFLEGVEAMRGSSTALADLDVPDRVARSLNLEPMRSAFDMLNVGTTPFDKLQYACNALETVSNCVRKADPRSDLAADVMVPVFAFSLAKYPPRFMTAHVAYTEQFLPDDATAGCDETRAYSLVSLRAAMQVVQRFGCKSTPASGPGSVTEDSP